MIRREFLKTVGLSTAAWLIPSLKTMRAAEGSKDKNRPNILLITADDMNWDALGCYGSNVSDITPHLDTLAGQGRRFNYAHVTIAVCQPSRSVLMTGRYPHRNGAEGFGPIDTTLTTLPELLHDAGYLNGILGKVTHLAPQYKFKWDTVQDFDQLVRGRSPAHYYRFAKAFFLQARKNNRPFFLMANSHDPHRPFHGSAQEARSFKNALSDIPPPSRVYQPDEISVPDFLPDLPEVRKEIAQYYSSVRRCDDTLGAVLKALDESQLGNNTLVMFLSDNGMALPFAKTNCYLNSTRTPWLARWPKKIKPASLDDDHFISGIDFLPTILDAVGLTTPPGTDGRSFVPLLLGKKQTGREFVFTQFHQTAGRKRFPMRCVQNKQFGYIFNPWSDGKRVFKNESQNGLTFKAMQQAAQNDPNIAARVKLFQLRTLEEFYDFQKDPDALRNIIHKKKYQKHLNTLCQKLLTWMKKTDDPAHHAFQFRSSPEAIEKFMNQQDQKAAKIPRKKKNKPKNPSPKLP
ncbi:MAG: sulfatase [Planctomycetes bacterium]|nr:sulfatase [Planctomycetota bacterium]